MLSVFETETSLFEPWERILTEPSAFTASGGGNTADEAPPLGDFTKFFEIAELAAVILQKTAYMDADMAGGIRAEAGRALSDATKAAIDEDVRARDVVRARANMRGYVVCEVPIRRASI